MKIIGLDVSTSITGCAVLDENGDVLESAAWRTEKLEGLEKKADFIHDQIDKLSEKYKGDCIVYIEDCAKKFSFGKSSAQTLRILSQFNGMITYISHMYFKRVEKLTPSRARSLCGVKVKRGENGKEKVFDLIKKESWFSYKETAKGNPEPGTYDRCDALIMARAGLKECSPLNK